MMLAVRGYTRMVIEGSAGLVNDEQRKLLGVVFENANRAVDRLNSVGDLLPHGEHISERVDVLGLLHENLGLIEDRARAIGTRVEKRLVSEPCSVMADRQALSIAFFLMMLNMLRISKGTGKVVVEAFSNGETSQLAIKVSHDGASLEAEQLSRILELGPPQIQDDFELGLCLVRDIVRRHGGHFSIENRFGERLSFVVRLPVTSTDLLRL
ncbi:MAG TPA: ATP-binding protein [Blastocatellia bacterium]|jgi:signal transduction histidine kinase|nr:ATP-binding protein [Blastocatellia bacterium]